MEVGGFGRGSAKSYGKFKDEPDNWPDTIGWIGFKGPTKIMPLKWKLIMLEILPTRATLLHLMEQATGIGVARLSSGLLRMINIYSIN